MPSTDRSARRPPAVAGLFYPGDPQVLGQTVTSLLGAAAPSRETRPPKAIIAPHAGYLYSGPIAASVYAAIAPLRGRIKRVVLLGPTHRVAVCGLALPGCAAFETPLGEVPLAADAVEQLRDLPQVVTSAAAHAEEHSLEVHLPFLQQLLGGFELVPLAVGQASAIDVAEVLDRLWGGEETLIVVSSDLSHYLPYEQARAIDTATAQAIAALRTDIDHEQACGATPVSGLTLAAQRRGMQARIIDVRNSGDTAGDRSRVVGYGAFAFYETEAHAH